MACKILLELATLLAFLCVHGVVSQIPIFTVRVENLLHMQEGIGWPVFLYVLKGNEALMRLTNTLPNMQTCQVTTPSGVSFDVRNPPSNRYEHWSGGCGLRIKTVEVSDHGRWRLVATAGTDELTGWSELHVEEEPQSPPSSEPITLQDGQTHVEVDLTTLDNSYCLVTQPFSESSLVPGHCSVTLDRTTRAVQGRWNVVLGLPGRVSELPLDRNVAVETEQLVSGYREDASKLHLFCNILHSEKNITFCRFQRNTESTGFNIVDGLSDGSYSYYGEGFARRQCGMTIETPSAHDYVVWRCTVGLQERVNDVVRPTTPMQALFKVSQPSGMSGMLADNLRTDDNERTLFVQKDSSFTIMCRGEDSLAYCWFQHPNGTAFTPVERQSEEESDFWYTGDSLQMGDCGITFAHVSEDDVGLWICHMGPRSQLGVELTDKVRVFVTGPLAANTKEVAVVINEEATLYCHTSNGRRPLDYCRFLNPNFMGIHIDSSITAENPILDRFYFTPERSLDYGDCSLTIKPVLEEDIGEWTCAALLHDGIEESRDNLTVYLLSSSRRLSTASIFGMVFGILALLVILATTVWVKKGRPIPWRRATNTTVAFSNTFSNTFTNELPEGGGFTPRSSPRSSNSSDLEGRAERNEPQVTITTNNPPYQNM